MAPRNLNSPTETLALSTQRTERKLAVILHADVASYSALMNQDEDLTHRRVTASFDRLGQVIQRYGGTVVEKRGDALLAQFNEPSDGVAAASMYQRAEVAERDKIRDGIQPRLRIGLNLGEVIIDRGTLWGPGVNLSQRIEQLAEPGGVCVSATVYDAISKSLPVDYEELGEQFVKDGTVRAFRACLRAHAEITPRACAEHVAEPARGSGKPSVAVLPFENMSGDRDQDYFSDGIAEDIITELSRFSTLVVIARHSSFSFKGRGFDIEDIAAKLGVMFIVEGSIRKAGNRVRVTAQLLEVASGEQLWSERYDRRMEDIFRVQDDVTQAVVSTLPGQIEAAVAGGTARKRTENMTAYECLLRGNRHYYKYTREEILEARRLYQRAVALDPDFAQAHSRIAATYNTLSNLGFESDTWEETVRIAQRALALDNNDGWTRLVLGWTLLRGSRFDEAEEHLERALALNPNDADTVVWIASGFVCLGRAGEALKLIERACRLNPLHPNIYHSIRGHAAYFDGQFEAARSGLRQGGAWDIWRRAIYAAACGQLGLRDEAEREYSRLGEQQRELVATFHRNALAEHEYSMSWLTRLYRRQSDRDMLLEGLRCAGMPG